MPPLLTDGAERLAHSAPGRAVVWEGCRRVHSAGVCTQQACAKACALSRCALCRYVYSAGVASKAPRSPSAPAFEPGSSERSNCPCQRMGTPHAPREPGIVELKHRTASYFTSEMSLFGNRRELRLGTK